MRISAFRSVSTVALAAQLKQQGKPELERLEELNAAANKAPTRYDAETTLLKEGAHKLEKELCLRAWEAEHGQPHHLQSAKKKKE